MTWTPEMESYLSHFIILSTPHRTVTTHSAREIAWRMTEEFPHHPISKSAVISKLYTLRSHPKAAANDRPDSR